MRAPLPYCSWRGVSPTPTVTATEASFAIHTWALAAIVPTWAGTRMASKPCSSLLSSGDGIVANASYTPDVQVPRTIHSPTDWKLATARELRRRLAAPGDIYMHLFPSLLPRTYARLRYVEWMNTRGRQSRGAPSEEVKLRIGDWIFYESGNTSGRSVGRVGLNRSLSAIEPHAAADWYVFLTTRGVGAIKAMKRVAWLFCGEALEDSDPRRIDGPDSSSAAQLVADGHSATLGGWMIYPSHVNSPIHLTITATTSGATLVVTKTLATTTIPDELPGEPKHRRCKTQERSQSQPVLGRR